MERCTPTLCFSCCYSSQVPPFVPTPLVPHCPHLVRPLGQAAWVYAPTQSRSTFERPGGPLNALACRWPMFPILFRTAGARPVRGCLSIRLPAAHASNIFGFASWHACVPLCLPRASGQQHLSNRLAARRVGPLVLPSSRPSATHTSTIATRRVPCGPWLTFFFDRPNPLG